MKRIAAVLATAFLLGAAPPAKKTPSRFDLTPDRVHFDLQGLAKSARGELRPAIPLPPEPEPGLGGEPANLRFHLGDEKIEEYVTSADRQVVIYPAPAWRQLFVQAGEEKGNPVDRLRSLLAKGSSAVAGEIPILPPAEAVQVLKARVKLLPFKGGKGFAFLTAYAQDDVPVANRDLFYTFQGLTDDGRYWIAFYYPVNGLCPNSVWATGGTLTGPAYRLALSRLKEVPSIQTMFGPTNICIHNSPDTTGALM